MNDAYDVRKNLLGRWYIVHPQDEHKAWSGSRWVPHYKGIPTEDVQICNFATPSELHKYALERVKQFHDEPKAEE